jgi:hypothetical protein
MGVHVSVSVVIRSGKEKEAAHKAKMQEVGQHIVRDPPSWLRDLLSDFSFDVYSANSIETMWPTRSQMCNQLVDGGSLAVKLSEVLKSPMVGFLNSNSDFDFEAVSELKNSLSKFAASARQARDASQLVGSNGKLLPGRGKPLLPTDMPAKYQCAAVIAEVWAFFNQDKEPVSSNRRAWTAADKFWRSWTPPKSWGKDPLTGWKRYFESVRDPRLKSLRNEVRRHLINRSTWAAQLIENNGVGNGAI